MHIYVNIYINIQSTNGLIIPHESCVNMSPKPTIKQKSIAENVRLIYIFCQGRMVSEVFMINKVVDMYLYDKQDS